MEGSGVRAERGRLRHRGGLPPAHCEPRGRQQEEQGHDGGTQGKSEEKMQDGDGELCTASRRG